MLLNTLPILSIGGDRGGERTFLIQGVIRHFQSQGVSVRCFSADNGLTSQQLLLDAKRYDLVVVEELRCQDVPVLWLAGEEKPPPDSQLIALIEKGVGRGEAMIQGVNEFLNRQWLCPPILGCILIGGRSTRMGQPKHLIERDGLSWLQRTASTLGRVSDQIVVVGQGDMGNCLLPRLPDVSGCSGPMAGLLSAMRSFPWSTILACACDMPEITEEALRWLLQQRSPGRRAVIPRVDGRYEPLLALYDFRFFPAVESLAAKRVWRLSSLAEVPGAITVDPPPAYCEAWRNVNSPEMLDPKDTGLCN